MCRMSSYILMGLRKITTSWIQRFTFDYKRIHIQRSTLMTRQRLQTFKPRNSWRTGRFILQTNYDVLYKLIDDNVKSVVLAAVPPTLTAWEVKSISVIKLTAVRTAVSTDDWLGIDPQFCHIWYEHLRCGQIAFTCDQIVIAPEIRT